MKSSGSSKPPILVTFARDPVRWLTRAALWCWVLSLVLPGFVVQKQSSETLWLGIRILPFGLLFGWLVMGWAVYANVLFFWVLGRVRKGKPAGTSIFFMLLLVATLPFFRGIVINEGSGAISPVASWGWGALIWLTALCLAIAASAVQQGWLELKVRQVQYGLVGLAGIYTLMIALHVYQWTQANIQEREMYLRGDMAFTVVPFCGVPLAWPEGALIEPDEILDLDIDSSLKGAKYPTPSIELPDFERYRSDGFEWVTYFRSFTSPVTVKVRYPAPPNPSRVSFQVKETGQGAMIRLVQNATGQVLYEQELRRRRQFGQRSGQEYCPDSGWPRKKGYQSALLRALGRRTDGRSVVSSRSKPQLQTETANESCDLGGQDIDGIEGLRAWDSRQVILDPDLRANKSLCSKTYIAIASVRNEPAGLWSRIDVFDRYTLRPLARFVSGGSISNDPRFEFPKDTIIGMRIANDAITVETTQGEVHATKR